MFEKALFTLANEHFEIILDKASQFNSV